MHFNKTAFTAALSLCHKQSFVPFYLKIFQIIYNSLRFWWIQWFTCWQCYNLKALQIWLHCQSWDNTLKFTFSYHTCKISGWNNLIEGQKDDWLRCDSLPESVLMGKDGRSFQCCILVCRGIINQSASS